LKVLLVEELAPRERLGLLFLRETLEARGHEVLLSNSWKLEEDCRNFDPKVVVDNVSYEPAHWLGKLAQLDETQRNVNLVWEQLVQPANLHLFRQQEVMTNRLVDGRISWGPAFRDVFLKENPSQDPSRIKVTGSIPHTILEAYRQIDPAKLRPILPIDPDGYERTVLVTDSIRAASKDPHQVRRK